MTSHSPASSPELPPLPDPVAIADGSFNCNAPLGSLLHTTDQILAYARAHGSACYEAGRASVASVAAWQPIETAPKDGTEVLLWREDCGRFIGSYVSADSFPLEQKEIDELTEEELFTHDWFTQWPDARRLEGSELPTLWQNLAAAPSATSLAEAAEAGQVEANEAWTRAMNAALTYRNADPEAIDEQDAWAALIDAIGALAATPALQEKKQ